MANSTVGGDDKVGESNPPARIVSRGILDDKQLTGIGEFTILSAQPANF